MRIKHLCRWKSAWWHGLYLFQFSTKRHTDKLICTWKEHPTTHSPPSWGDFRCLHLITFTLQYRNSKWKSSTRFLAYTSEHIRHCCCCSLSSFRITMVVLCMKIPVLHSLTKSIPTTITRMSSASFPPRWNSIIVIAQLLSSSSFFVCIAKYHHYGCTRRRIRCQSSVRSVNWKCTTEEEEEAAEISIFHPRTSITTHYGR